MRLRPDQRFRLQRRLSQAPEQPGPTNLYGVVRGILPVLPCLGLCPRAPASRVTVSFAVGMNQTPSLPVAAVILARMITSESHQSPWYPEAFQGGVGGFGLGVDSYVAPPTTVRRPSRGAPEVRLSQLPSESAPQATCPCGVRARRRRIRDPAVRDLGCAVQSGTRPGVPGPCWASLPHLVCGTIDPIGLSESTPRRLVRGGRASILAFRLFGVGLPP